MITTWWILLIFFGVLGLNLLRKYFVASVSKFEVGMMFLSVIIAAISAGMIWG